MATNCKRIYIENLLRISRSPGKAHVRLMAALLARELTIKDPKELESIAWAKANLTSVLNGTPSPSKPQEEHGPNSPVWAFGK